MAKKFLIGEDLLKRIRMKVGEGGNVPVDVGGKQSLDVSDWAAAWHIQYSDWHNQTARAGSAWSVWVPAGSFRSSDRLADGLMSWIKAHWTPAGGEYGAVDATTGAGWYLTDITEPTTTPAVETAWMNVYLTYTADVSCYILDYEDQYADFSIRLADLTVVNGSNWSRDIRQIQIGPIDLSGIDRDPFAISHVMTDTSTQTTTVKLRNCYWRRGALLREMPGTSSGTASTTFDGARRVLCLKIPEIYGSSANPCLEWVTDLAWLLAYRGEDYSYLPLYEFSSSAAVLRDLRRAPVDPTWEAS